MKTWKEILGLLNLTEEQKTALDAALKDKAADGKEVTLEIVISNNGEYVKASKYNELDDKFKALDLEYKTKSSEYAGLEKVAAESNDLKEKLEALKTESAKERALLKKKSAMERKWLEDGLPPINDSYEAYHSAINYDGITELQSGKFDGINEQHKAFKEANAKLYEKTTSIVIEGGEGGNPANAKKGTVATFEEFSKMTYSQQMAFSRENPVVFNEYFNKT